ncbi:hypothetical protein BDN71DRAFT_1443657 [Pleurotus eryngii]|uniref:C2H2-type domain-containing protein n=1 Tax=Pleurotus eryngii TaxID=5323 RepID=A0A9P6A1A2_PLEER|nr:hypothetical protein BDN71DRAFT_1443657 [Pleurotus eryngii]
MLEARSCGTKARMLNLKFLRGILFDVSSHCDIDFILSVTYVHPIRPGSLLKENGTPPRHSTEPWGLFATTILCFLPSVVQARPVSLNEASTSMPWSSAAQLVRLPPRRRKRGDVSGHRRKFSCHSCCDEFTSRPNREHELCFHHNIDALCIEYLGHHRAHLGIRPFIRACGKAFTAKAEPRRHSDRKGKSCPT